MTLTFNAKQSARVIIDDNLNELQIKHRQKALARKKLYTYLTNVLEDYLVPRTQALATVVSSNKNFRTIRTKLVRSLWGSCSRSGNLTFNKKLVHYPSTIIDYVIIHELAHLQHHNHSAKFWELVQKYYPEVKKARLVLKNRECG